MMKKNVIKGLFSILLLSLFSFSACVKDTSVYLRQEKKEVTVDEYDIENTQPGGIEGALVPGVNLVKLMVVYNGSASERRFKYFMPVSIDRSKPISLIFDFHGSYSAGVDPIAGVSMTQPLSQLAIKENCIIVYPAGEDTGSAVNWQNSELHLPFVDAMIDYFKSHTPLIDINRIYTSGHSSGAIFSFVLAYNRADVFAAAVPVSGQMKLSGTNFPNRAVPIRAFNGKIDDIVSYTAAVSNINIWANSIGGYFPSDAVNSDTLAIDNYKSYLTKKWSGGKTDIELYTILDEGHAVNWYYIMPLMWEFMKNHPKNVGSSGLYISSEVKRFDAIEGQFFTSEIRSVPGATIELVAAPSDWEVTFVNNRLTVKAPNDFFAASTLNRKGEIKLRTTKDGVTAEISLPFTLSAPKPYYEVGDVVYDTNSQPQGVVFWVNPSNIKQAKIIGLEHVTRAFGAVGTSFSTPDYADGYANTLALIERSKDLKKITAANSAFVYAYEYKAGSGNHAGWYLPAVDELKAIDRDITVINETLKKYGTVLDVTSATTSYYMSSTVVISGGTKQFYTFDFGSNPSRHGYYPLAANSSDNTTTVSTRPIKKVAKP